jgi:serine/threonine protein phosphatase PrpC
MKITIFPPIACSEKGRRANNQDSIFPQQANCSDKLFLVCDGVGGMSQGSDASRIVCESFGSALADKDFSDQKIMDEALFQAEFALNAFAKTQTLPKGIATTLTLLHLHPQGATIAHIGDSRVYQIRDGSVVFKTHDHSWVNELVSQGVITPEQAQNHPQRNVIARAIQAEKPAKVEVKLLTDLQPNDYFFLCSDGILESCAEESLLLLMQQDRPNEEKINMIQERCRLHSKDNFSCYLIQIQSITQEESANMNVTESVVPVTPALTTVLETVSQVQDAAPTTVLKSVAQDLPTEILSIASVPAAQDAPTSIAPAKLVAQDLTTQVIVNQSVMPTSPTIKQEPTNEESGNHSTRAAPTQTYPPQTPFQKIVLWILFLALLGAVTTIWWRIN